jgi:hypothetical protein
VDQCLAVDIVGGWVWCASEGVKKRNGLSISISICEAMQLQDGGHVVAGEL